MVLQINEWTLANQARVLCQPCAFLSALSVYRVPNARSDSKLARFDLENPKFLIPAEICDEASSNEGGNVRIKACRPCTECKADVGDQRISHEGDR